MGRYARVAAAVGVAAAAFLPFATYRNVAVARTTTFHGGFLAVAMAVCALAAGGVSLAPPVRYRLIAGILATAALVLAAVGAATRIKMANDTANRLGGPSRTSYAAGSGVALIAATALVVLVAAAFGEAKRHARAR